MCGLIGIIDGQDAAALAVEGLYSQQHRGTEAAGVASTDGMGIHLAGGLGKVADVFHEGRDIPRELPGVLAIGHVRYSTVESQIDLRNASVYQPIRGRYGDDSFCLAHNGNITNTSTFCGTIDPSTLTSTVDTEMVARLIEKSYTGDLMTDLSGVFNQLRGSYCFLILFRDEIIAVRDPTGNRPLSYGGDTARFVFASESCAFETLNVRRAGEVEPGTFFRIGSDRQKRVHRFVSAHEKKCSFEPVYFSHHAGETFGIPLTDFRLRLGEALEKECPAETDIVLGVPDSAMVIGMGYGKSKRSGEYVPALTRHHHAGGRTFILPHQDKREAAVRRKFQCSVDSIKGRRVALVDDSIVRGTTMKLLVDRIRQAGATEVHVRSAFPTIKHPCRYGVDTPDRSKLIASTNSLKEISNFIGANSVAFLSNNTLMSVLGGKRAGWCTACVTGNYWHRY